MGRAIKDLTVLRPLERSGKEFEIVVFPRANYRLRVMKPGSCRGTTFSPELDGTMNHWLQEHAG